VSHPAKPWSTFNELFILPGKVPPEGALPRCRHGAYWPGKNGHGPDAVNESCWLCRPFGFGESTRFRLRMPSVGDALNERDRARANGHDRTRYCPKCGSAFAWTDAEDTDGTGERACADCGHAWAPKPARALMSIRHV